MRHASFVRTLPVFFLLGACDRGGPPKEQPAQPDRPAQSATAPATEGDNTKLATSKGDLEPASEITPATPPKVVEPPPADTPEMDGADIPSAPLATLTEFGGPLRFNSVEAGDGKLPADNVAMLEESGGTMMDHPTQIGWTADGKAFGYCMPGAGANCGTCQLITVGSDAVETWKRGSDCELDAGEKDDSKAVAAVWKSRKIGELIPKDWAFGRDLVIAWRYVDGEQQHELSYMQIGARIGDAAPIWSLTMKEQAFAEYETTYDIFPEVILPSPDGRWLAVMSHAFAGEYSDTLSVAFLDTAQLAFATYRGTARLLQAKDPERAAQLLAAAAKIKPSAPPPVDVEQ